MRIHVYSQELLLNDEPILVEKTGTNSDGNQETFKGVRVFLASPEVLHDTPNDDDRTAITFWMPSDINGLLGLRQIFDRLAALVDDEIPGIRTKQVNDDRYWEDEDLNSLR